ncbi:hypothetical protein AOLI_G00219960 [Acnodon oligacanthus]
MLQKRQRREVVVVGIYIADVYQKLYKLDMLQKKTMKRSELLERMVQ